MKKILYSIPVVIVLLFCNCEDYLNVKPKGYDIPDKMAHYEGLLFGKDAYYNPIFFYMSFEYDSDKESFENAVSQIKTPSQYNAFRWYKDLYTIAEKSTDFEMPYNLLHTYNIVANDVMSASDGTQQEKEAIRAEARMLRAWWTFILAQNYGKPYNGATAATDPCVPIVTKAEVVGGNYKIASVQEVYDYVIAEMSESLPLLQNRESHTFRVFSVTGYAMLGKVYWMQGKYDKALEYLEEAVNLSKNDTRLKLLNYNEMLDQSGLISKHPQQYESSETVYFTEFDSFAFRIYMLARRKLPTFYLKNELIEKYYTSEDTRLANLSGIDSNTSAYTNFDKNDKYVRNINIVTINMGISLPDVYLMYSECLARESRLDEAKSILFEFRKNRMPESNAAVPSVIIEKEDLIKFIISERMRENFACGTSWYDTRRLWNDPLFQEMKQYYTHNDGETVHQLTEARLTLSIPPNILEWHPEFERTE